MAYMCSLAGGWGYISDLVNIYGDEVCNEGNLSAIALGGYTLGRVVIGAFSDRVGKQMTYLLLLGGSSFVFLLQSLSEDTCTSRIIYITVNLFIFGGSKSIFGSFLFRIFGGLELPTVMGFILTAYGAAGIYGPTIFTAVLPSLRTFAGIMSITCLVGFMCVIPIEGTNKTDMECSLWETVGGKIFDTFLRMSCMIMPKANEPVARTLIVIGLICTFVPPVNNFISLSRNELTSSMYDTAYRLVFALFQCLACLTVLYGIWVINRMEKIFRNIMPSENHETVTLCRRKLNIICGLVWAL
eukprot:UN24312